MKSYIDPIWRQPF